jgi:pyruvate kinase
MEKVQNPSQLIFNFIKKIVEEKRVTMNKRFILTMGSTSGKKGSTNLIRLLNREEMEAILALEF